MRVALGAVMLVGLASCQSHHGIAVIVQNGDKEVRSIRLFIGTGDSATSSLTPSSKVQVDDAEYWVRDPGNQSDVVTVDGQTELRFVFETDGNIPVAIAVGYDQDHQPIAAGLLHDLSPVDGSDFTGYELALTSPIAPIGAQGEPMQIALWSPDAATSQFDAACAGVVVAGEDHPYFVVAEQDQDCDGLLDGEALECNPDEYLGMRPADPSETSCLLRSVGPAGDSDCQLGGEPCKDNVPRGSGTCVASHTCVPFELCPLCTDRFDCAADLEGAGHTDVSALVHYECPIQHKPDGTPCGETLALDRPPTGGYDCTGFQIGDAGSPLGDQLTASGVTFDATLKTGGGTSCDAELVASGHLGSNTSITALVAFTLKNKAGVAIPIHFSAGSSTSCSSADTRCTLSAGAFDDPEFTQCAAQWSAPMLVTSLIGPGGDAAEPTLTSDQLTIYFVSGGKLFTAQRTANTGPWSTPMPVVFNGLATDVTIRTPKVSPDGTKMFLDIIDASATVEQLFFARRATSNTSWEAPVPVLYVDAVPLTLTAATFGPGNRAIFAAHEAIGAPELFEGAFDETTTEASMLTALPLDTSASEDAPSLSLDGLQLYYQSNLSGQIVPYVASRKNVDDTFTTATRLEELESGTGIDGSPWVSNGARTMYFTRGGTSGGPARIYTATRTTF